MFTASCDVWLRVVCQVALAGVLVVLIVCRLRIGCCCACVGMLNGVVFVVLLKVFMFVW